MADINVTPLVDVMLVLLIIFMVTAPLLTAGVPVNLPDSRAKRARPGRQADRDLARRARPHLHRQGARSATPSCRGGWQLLAAQQGPDGQPPQMFLRADRRSTMGG